MNTSTLLPKDVLLALRPGDVSLYLTSHGWAFKPYGAAGQALQFRNPAMRGVDLLVPLTRDLGDYAQRLADLIVALATIEKRPFWEILNDLSAPSGDALRLKIVRASTSQGSAPSVGAVERFRGKVVSLKRALRPLLPEVAGWMVMAADVSGIPARVKVDLVSDDFVLACEALRDDLSVEVNGVIRRDVKAREYVLTEPSEFQVLSE
jgi:hypothetical protein